MRGEEGFPLRLRFSKLGPVRFISHRDVARAFERAFRIVELPIAFTQGFSPRPKVSFGLALPVGAESRAEYLDIALDATVEPGAAMDSLSAALPEGIAVTGAAALEPRAPALQELVTSVAYEIRVTGTGEAGDLAEVVDAALASPTLVTTRRRKGVDVSEDIRPAIRTLAVRPDGVLVAEVATHPRGARPTEVVAAINSDLEVGLALRTHQWIERGGARLEPLEANTRSRVPEACAS